MALSRTPGGKRPTKPTPGSASKRSTSADLVPVTAPTEADVQAQLFDAVMLQESAEEVGLTYKASSTSNANQELRRFERWLDELVGVDLDDVLSPGSRRGWKAIDAEVVLAYLTGSARFGAITKTSFTGNRDRLWRAFAMRRIEAPDGDDFKALVDGLASNLELGDRKPTAACYLGCGLEDVDAAIEARYGSDELRTAALVAYHRLAGTFGGRITETVAHLRWGNVKLDDGEMLLTWPAGLKYQDEAIRLRYEGGDDGGEVVCSPIEALHALRRLSTEAGLPTDDGDRIFPVRVEGEWTVNGEEERIADETWRPELTAEKERRHHARAANSAEYRNDWTKAAMTTEWSKHVGHRRIAPHGLRRGQATLMMLDNRSLSEIQFRLRHGTQAVTLKYTDGTQLDLGSVTGLLDAAADPDAQDDTDARIAAWMTGLKAGDAVVLDDDDEPTTNLPVLDWTAGCSECGARQANVWPVKVAGEFVVLCGPHAKRLRVLGEDSDWQDFGLRCQAEGCDKNLNETSSSHPATRSDGHEIRVCQACYLRYRNRKADDDEWMKSKGRELTAKTCEATGYAVDGVSITQCTREPSTRITLDCGTELEVCGGHHQRLDKQLEIAKKNGDKIEMVAGVISGQWGTPIRPRFKPGEGPDCQVETSTGPCGRKRAGWIETATKGWVACCNTHKGWASRNGVRQTDPEGWPNADIKSRS